MATLQQQKRLWLGLALSFFVLAMLAIIFFPKGSDPKPGPIAQAGTPIPQPTPTPTPTFAVNTGPQFWDMTSWGDGQTLIGAYYLSVPPGGWHDTGILVKPGTHIIWNFINGTSGRLEMRIGGRTFSPTSVPLQGNSYYEIQAIAGGKEDSRLFVVHDVPRIELRSVNRLLSVRLELWFNPHWAVAQPTPEPTPNLSASTVTLDTQRWSFQGYVFSAAYKITLPVGKVFDTQISMLPNDALVFNYDSGTTGELVIQIGDQATGVRQWTDYLPLAPTTYYQILGTDDPAKADNGRVYVPANVNFPLKFQAVKNNLVLHVESYTH